VRSVSLCCASGLGVSKHGTHPAGAGGAGTESDGRVRDPRGVRTPRPRARLNRTPRLRVVRCRSRRAAPRARPRVRP
jgi:hypothetical protein